MTQGAAPVHSKSFAGPRNEVLDRSGEGKTNQTVGIFFLFKFINIFGQISESMNKATDGFQ